MADIADLLKDVAGALAHYRDLRQLHPDHEAVKDSSDDGPSVRRRMEQCYSLPKKMALEK